MAPDVNTQTRNRAISGVLMYSIIVCGLTLVIGSMIPENVASYLPHCWILIAAMVGNTSNKTLKAAFASPVMGVVGIASGVVFAGAYFILAYELFGAMDLSQAMGTLQDTAVVLGAVAIVVLSNIVAHQIAKRLFSKSLATWI